MLKAMLMFISRVFTKKTVNQLKQVFTPSSYAFTNYTKRPEIEDKLIKALEMPGMQIVVYGHSGGGKSTLVNKILKQKGINCILTPCVIGTSIDQLILDAFDKLDAFYINSITDGTKVTISSRIKANYLALSSEIHSSVEVDTVSQKKRLLPPQLNSQRLIDFIGAANCIWVIDDFHKVDESEKKKLSQIMKLFVDASNTYEGIKIIAIGACDTAREVVEYDLEMSNRVAEINVPLLSPPEIASILNNGASLLNIEFSKDLVNGIIKNSNKLASIAHHLAYNICYGNGVSQTSNTHRLFDHKFLADSIRTYIGEKSDTYKKLFDEVTRHREREYRNVELILKAMAQLDDEQSHNDVLTKIQEELPKYPPSNLSHYLKLMTSPALNEIVRQDNASGKYSYSDPFFKAFVTMQFRIQASNDILSIMS